MNRRRARRAWLHKLVPVVQPRRRRTTLARILHRLIASLLRPSVNAAIERNY